MAMLATSNDWTRSTATLSALLVLLTVLACDRLDSSPAASVPTPTASESEALVVKVVDIAPQPWPTTLRVTGSIEVDERSALGAKIAGRIAEILVDVGSEVKTGDLVARLDDVDARLRVSQVTSLVRQARALLGLPLDGDSDAIESEDTAKVRLARAVLADAAAKRARAETLHEQDALDDAERDEAIAAEKVAQEQVQTALQEITNLRGALEQRRAELAISKQQLSDTEIRAPYDGVVMQRLAGRGDFVTVGTPIVALSRVDPMRLRLEVNESDAPRVMFGQKVEFTVQGDPTSYSAVVSRLPPELNPRNRSLIVEAAVENPPRHDDAKGTTFRALRGASFVRASIVVDDKASVIAVPETALRRFAGVDRVLVVENGKAKEVLVAVGRQDGARREITSGLLAGARVIVEPGSLQTGRAVRPVPMTN